jgi:hypothetical protein
LAASCLEEDRSVEGAATKAFKGSRIVEVAAVVVAFACNPFEVPSAYSD